MGNTRYYTKANGQSYAELTYDAWGMPESPNKLLNNDHGNYVYATYTGHIFDTTLDIYFCEARFYDANTRTWLAMDPIKDGDNWYQYCYSNPLKYWDPTGLSGFSILDCHDINDITSWFNYEFSNMQNVLGALNGLHYSVNSTKQIALGLLALGTALTAIITSAPVSLPILLMTIAGGSITTAFGVSNLIEGWNMLKNALSGTDEAANNPIRDSLFRDNPELYYVIEVLAGLAAALGSGSIIGTLESGAKRVNVNKIISSASQPKKGGESIAGHALQKHAGRNPNIWGKVRGNSEAINRTAMQHIDDILNGPGNFKKVVSNGHSFLEKMLPDGRGIRLNMDGTFKGFIDQIR